jgi:hypothetical protein
MECSGAARKRRAWPTIERILTMKRAIVSVMVAVALLVTGVTVTSFKGISAAHALEAGGDE